MRSLEQKKKHTCTHTPYQTTSGGGRLVEKKIRINIQQHHINAYSTSNVIMMRSLKKNTHAHTTTTHKRIQHIKRSQDADIGKQKKKKYTHTHQQQRNAHTIADDQMMRSLR